MNDVRFDAWTRRRLGFAAGGAVAALVGRGGGDETAAGRRRRRKKKRCRKLLARCTPGKAPRCCKGSECGTSQIVGSFCCTPEDRACRFSPEQDACCPGFACSEAAGVCVPLE